MSLKTFKERRGVAGRFHGIEHRRAVGESRYPSFDHHRPHRATTRIRPTPLRLPRTGSPIPPTIPAGTQHASMQKKEP